MIVFEKIRWKNFLSTGDKFTEIFLDRTPTTLIVGQNGAGKSTLLDALAFALFGKPHRDIKKAQLVNSINNKKAVVEVEFYIGNQKMKVVRGIKPNIFEIWQNGKQINQDSNARDFQKFLEQNILKLNHKSFHQIVVLGSSSFIPFMQLNNNHRREVIEDLLDIGVFSKMNVVLKEWNGKLRESIKDTDYQLELTKDKVNVQKKYIKELEGMNNELITKKQNEIVGYQEQIKETQSENEQLSVWIQENQQTVESEHIRQSSDYEEIKKYIQSFKTQMSGIVREAKFYDENDSCPTCNQDISESLKSTKVEAAKTKATELQEAMDNATKISTDMEQSLESLNTQIQSISAKQQHIHSNNRLISGWQAEISDRENDILSISKEEGGLDEANKSLDELQQAKDDLTEVKLTHMEKQNYYGAIIEMLKDSGIKTKIIKQYLPVMNKLINNYLQVLDFFVSFHLDESFTETIKSRHRDQFNYASFSEGEKQRIDLALMFTWRQIARMKNSVATNLLILDETFDSSLDNDGIDNLFKIMETLDNDTNVFIISHKGDVLENKFRSKIEFVKEHNFSIIKK